MLVADKEFTDAASLEGRLTNSVFKFCTFKKFSVDGKSVDGIFYNCLLTELDWYWGLFNACLFVDVKFENCTFRGTSFTECRFLDCEFVNCKFVEDNLASPCTFEKARWFACTVANCPGLPADAEA